MPNIIPPTIISPTIISPTIIPPNRPPNCHTSPYIMPLPNMTMPISTHISTPINPYTNKSSSIAKKVTDDLFASSAFFGTNPANKDKYCSFLKDQLNKCVTKKEDCIHIKNMYDEVCSSLILTKPA